MVKFESLSKYRICIFILNWQPKISLDEGLDKVIHMFEQILILEDYNPKVSVIMNVHNGEQYISEAIQSVVQQKYSNWELIIWDNVSIDKTFYFII